MRISPFVLMLALLGCSEAPSGGGEPPTQDRTSSLILEVEVGHESGTEFAYVSDAAVAEDGSLYVLDPRSRHVLWFDSSGNIVGELGGPGEGPGEFQSPVAIAIDRNHVMIWDIGAWRVTTFDTSGALVGTEPVPPRRESGWPGVVRYSQEGEWLYLDQEIETPDQAGVEVRSGIIRGVAHLLSWRSGSQWIERAQFPGMEAALVEYDGEVALSNAPFPAGPLWASGPDGSIWYADSRSYSISKRGGGKDTTDVITANVRGSEVTDSAWHAFVGGSAGNPATPEARRRSKLPRPDMEPVLARMVSNRNTGELWVQLRNNGRSVANEWHVYSPDGAPRFRVQLPREFRIHKVVGDWIVGDIRDSMDVQTVRRYRIDSAAGERTTADY